MTLYYLRDKVQIPDPPVVGQLPAVLLLSPDTQCIANGSVHGR